MSKFVRLCYCQDCIREVRGDDSQFPQVITANEHVFPELTADGHVQGSLNVVGANPYVCHAFDVHVSSSCMVEFYPLCPVYVDTVPESLVVVQQGNCAACVGCAVHPKGTHAGL